MQLHKINMTIKISNGLKKISIVVFLALAAVLGSAPFVSATVTGTAGSGNSAAVSSIIPSPSGKMCAQVITSAASASGECRSFPTPCDVPEGWTKVRNCLSGESSTTGDINNRLQQMRNNLKDFKDKKAEEETALAQSVKEKVASKKKAAEAVRTAAQKIKEEKRKTVLLDLVDIQIKQFMSTKERVAKMPNITGDQKNQLNTKIDSAIAVLDAEKIKIQAATTPEEVKKFAKEIKDLFKEKRDVVRQIVNAILISRTNSAISKAEGRLAEIQTKITELKASGKDVSSLDALLASTEAKLAAAKTATGKENIKDAVDALKEAYKELQKAIAKINGVSVPTSTPTATSAATLVE